MLFNSYEFIFCFLPIVTLVYYLIGKYKVSLANPWLLVCSLFFYAYWNYHYLILLLGSILFNWEIGNRILNSVNLKMKKLFFCIGMVCDVALLCYYKYVDFFIDNFNFVMGTSFTAWQIILPLGISFFTITQMVYLVDVREGGVKDNNFVRYALFVSFFPHLLSGPILHHRPMMRQFADEKTKLFKSDTFIRGLMLFFIGLFKKTIIADNFIHIVDIGFSHNAALSFVDSWMIAWCYAFQLYFDFSGYSDMAVGVAQMLNIKIPINFNSPFRAKNVIDFWNRWHISLTNVITDYLYVSVVQLFKAPTFFIKLISTLITMTLIGFWHGAGWTYITYGAMHGVALMANQTTKHKKIEIPHVLARVCTIVFVLCGFVMFRAPDVEHALRIYEGMLGIHGVAPVLTVYGKPLLLLCVICLLIIFKFSNSNELIKQMQWNWKWGIAFGAMSALAVMGVSKVTTFLYFQY